MPSSLLSASAETLHNPSPSFDVLRRDIERELFPVPHCLQRFVRVEREGNEILLRGVVESYYQKQQAQEYLRKIPGIGRIRNELVVLPPGKVF